MATDELEAEQLAPGGQDETDAKKLAGKVQERYGLYWTYMGPAPVPVLPRFDVAEVGTVRHVSVSRQDCNWLQVAENNLDQSHTVILHQATRDDQVSFPQRR